MRAAQTLALAQNAAVEAEERRSTDTQAYDEKAEAEAGPPPEDGEEKLQAGVAQAEAMTQSWSRSALITLYVL